MIRGLVVLLVAAPVVECAVTRGSNFLKSANRMRPELVAQTLANVEDEWKQQALAFTECDASGAKADCNAAPNSFSRSCATVVSAVVQGSGGRRNVAKEYMTTVCNQKVLVGWHKLRCSDLTDAIIEHAMTANDVANRESLNPTKLCSSFWFKFVDAERKREAVEAKERAEREAKEAKERAEREKIEAEEAAKSKLKAEAEAKAEAERSAKQDALRAQKEKEENAKREAEEAKARAAEAAARLAQKKAEAEEVAKAAQLKLKEAELAEQEHLHLQAEHEKAEETLKNANAEKVLKSQEIKVPPAQVKESEAVAAPVSKVAAVKESTTVVAPVAKEAEPAAKAATTVAKAVAPAEQASGLSPAKAEAIARIEPSPKVAKAVALMELYEQEQGTCGPQTKVCLADTNDAASNPVWECKVAVNGEMGRVSPDASRNGAMICGPGSFHFSPMQCAGDKFEYKKVSEEIVASSWTGGMNCPDGGKMVSFPHEMACYKVEC